MLVTDHLLAQAETLELQGWRVGNTSSLTTPVAGSVGLMRYLTTGATGPYYYDGTAWKHFGTPATTGTAGSRDYPGFPLAETYLLQGNSSGVARETAPNTISLDKWGAAAGNINMSGAGGPYRIVGLAEPTAASDAATRSYVDTKVQGLAVKTACQLASASILPYTPTYSGVAMTLTGTGNSALTAVLVDPGATSFTLQVGHRLLIKGQQSPNQFQNGLYVVTKLGGSEPYVLTRTDDANTNAELLGAFTFVESGSFANTSWNNTSTVYEIGTGAPSGAIIFSQMFGAGSWTGGNGIVISGNTIHFATSVAYTQYSLFYAASGTQVVERKPTEYVTGTSSGRFLQQDSNVPRWSKLTVPHDVAINTMLYASAANEFGALAPVNATVLGSTTAGVPTWVPVADNSVLIKNGTGVAPSWGTSLPFVIGLAGGGTGVSNSGVGSTGSLVFRTAGNVLSPSALSPTTNQIPQWTGSAWQYFDIFNTENTWGAEQHHLAHVILRAGDPAASATSVSPRLTMAAAGNNAGTITWQEWDYTVTVTDTAGAGYLSLSSGAPTGPGATAIPGSVTEKYRFHSGGTTNGDFYMAGSRLRMAHGAGFTGEIVLPTLTATRTYSLPDSSGTFALLSLAQTWTAKQAYNHATSTTVVWATQTAGSDSLTVDAAGKFSWGGSANLYESAANTLKTDGNFDVGGNLTVTGTINGGTWGGGIVTLDKGGTGADFSIAQNAVAGRKPFTIPYKNGSSATDFIGLDPDATANKVLMTKGASAAPAWSSYALPGPAPTVGAVMYANATTTTAWTASATTTAILTSSAIGVVTWGGILNPARTTGAATAGGIARKYTERKAGGGVNTITITHALGTYDVGVWVRKSDATNDVDAKRSTTTGAPYEQVLSRIDVMDKDSVRITFGANQTASDWWVITVVG